MTLFSTPDDPWSHRTRIVIAEKAIEIEIVDVAPGKYPEDLLDLNPYHTTPTLIGSAKSPVTVNGTTPTVSSNGGTSDLWGATLTPAIVNAAGFGVAIWSTDTG